jgi:hypothetical protein
MKKKLPLKNVLLAMATCIATGTAFAQTPTITVDGNPGDWPAVLGTQAYPTKWGHDLFNTGSDDVYTSGASATSAVASWMWGTGAQPNAKSDIENSAVAIVGHTLYFFADRYAGNGDVNLDVWLFAGNVGKNSAPPTFYGAHQDGDMLIRSYFTQGGGTLLYNIYKWVGGAPVLQSYPTSTAMVVSNTGNPNVPTGMPAGFSYTYKVTGSAGSATNPGSGKYPQSTFLEGRLNLDAIGDDQLAQCFQSYIITTTTSSSTSLTSAYTDLVAGNFPSKPSAFVTNSDITICNGESATFHGGALAGYGTAPYSYKWTNTSSCASTACVVGTGADLPLTPTVSGTYYLTAYSDFGCVSIPIAAHITVNTTDAPTTTGASACTASGPATLSASGTGMLNWYADATGGSSLNEGATYTPTVTATTNYYVSATNAVTTCTSTRTLVTYTWLTTHIVTASQVGGGTITVDGSTPVGAYCDGQTVIYYFEGYDGAPVQDVKVDGDSQGPITSYTFENIDEDHTLDVSFCNPTTEVLHDAVNVNDVSFNTEAGACGANITLSPATANGMPAPSITYSAESGFFSLGTTTVTVNAANACGSASATYDVIVVDDQSPVFSSVPSPITVNANNSDCTWTVVTPTATDNCSVIGVPVTGVIGTSSVPAALPVGTYTITWTATDASGNSTPATQIVTVVNPVTVDVTANLLPVISNGTQTPGALYWGYQNITFTATTSNTTGDVTYVWNSGAGSSNNAVYPTHAGASTFSETVTITDGIGCTASASSATVTKNVIDDRCGSTNEKMAICHWDNGHREWKTICIGQLGVPDHMAPGHEHDGNYDYCGPCGAYKGAAPGTKNVHEISLYPNPNKGSFTIEIPAIAQDMQITIMDINGRVVETRKIAANENAQHLEISLGNISKGIYMVQAIGGAYNFHTKLVIE